MSINWKECAKYAALGAGVGLLFAGMLSTCVRADTLSVRLVPVVPTIPGIEAGRAPDYSPYPRRTLDSAPSAAVLRLWDEAPPNACGPGRFEVVSGPKAQRGCY